MREGMPLHLSTSRRWALGFALACYAILMVFMWGAWATIRLAAEGNMSRLIAVSLVATGANAVVIVELARIAIRSFASWSDRKHFRSVGVVWGVFFVVSMGGMLLWRGSLGR